MLIQLKINPFLTKYSGLWTRSTVFFKNVDHITRRTRLQKRSFATQLIMANTNYVSKLCVLCELETSNMAVFFNIFIFSAWYGNKYDKPWRRPMGLMSHSTSFGVQITPLSCGYVINNFLSTFTPFLKKSFKNVVTWQTRKLIFLF